MGLQNRLTKYTETTAFSTDDQVDLLLEELAAEFPGFNGSSSFASAESLYEQLPRGRFPARSHEYLAATMLRDSYRKN
jgi:hypothetical protein